MTLKIFTVNFNALALCCSLSAFAENEQHSWPNNALAAVSLSYDDTLASQLDNAIPALDKYDLKGSFYLTLASPTFKARKLEWQNIAKHGHELGNHTINHACRGSLPNRSWVDPKNDLDNKKVAELVAEVVKANQILMQLDNQTIRTFTLPCTDTLAGGRNYLKAITPLFIGMKTRVGGIPETMKGSDIKNVAVISAENLTGEQLIAYVKQAADKGTMVNFTFHGVGGDYLSITAAAHDTLLKFLANNKKRYWVDTFRNISLHIINNKE